MDLAELEQKHDRLQTHILIGVSIGAVGSALSELLELTGSPLPLDMFLSILTMAGWVFAIWALIRTANVAKHPQFKVLARDERYASLRAEACAAGFAAMIVVQLVFLIGNDVLNKLIETDLNASFVASTSIAIGFVASLGRFVYLNR